MNKIDSFMQWIVFGMLGIAAVALIGGLITVWIKAVIEVIKS